MQPNYRVGPFGFFTTGTADAPGNYAVWDALNVLRFAVRMASSFGGNPDNVILAGQGSGGTLSHSLTYSPLAWNLYAKVGEWEHNRYNKQTATINTLQNSRWWLLARLLWYLRWPKRWRRIWIRIGVSPWLQDVLLTRSGEPGTSDPL